MRYFLLIFQIVLVVGIADQADARTALQKRLGDWVTIRHTFDNGSRSCQAIQCTSGNCGRNRFFLIVGSKQNPTAWPSYNHGSELPGNTAVTLIVGGKKFTLRNSDSDRKFFDTSGANDARSINSLLLALSTSSGSKKFAVVDPNGQKQLFSAGRADDVLAAISEGCGTSIP